MKTTSSPHPDAATLQAYALGKLAESPAEAVDQHLEECDECRSAVASMSADSFLGRVQHVENARTQTSGASARVAKTMSGPGGVAPETQAIESAASSLIDHPGYEIRRELGRGGMGVVYLAHNSLMGRDEVLKMVGKQIVDRPGVLDRFLREIRAVAKLRHPNIVTAFSASRLEDSVVFAMEYVEGLDLAKLVKAKGPLPVAHACNFIYQAALGLQHAHEEGLVHRDIKPGNLMLSRNGTKATIKVLDFGLSKVAREEKVDLGLTFEGQALGTPDFIAPEQIIDAPNADIRADIYSLGGTLYYLLTGRPPFQAKSLYDMYQAHLSRDADPLNLVRPDVPSELAALVAKMMSKDPARRFQTPGEVAEALKPFFRQANTMVKTPRPEISTLQSTIAEPQWESLITFRETGTSEILTLTESRNDKPPRRWGAIAAGSAALALLLGVVIIVVIGKNRVTIVKPDVQPGSSVKVVGGEKQTAPESGQSSTDPQVPKPTPASGTTTATTVPPPARFDLTQFNVSGEGTIYGDRKDPRTGKWYTEGDELVMRFGVYDTHNPPRATVMFGDPQWTDYDFTYKVRQVDPASDNWSAFYLVFRSRHAEEQYEYMVQDSRNPQTLLAFDLPHPAGEDISKDKNIEGKKRNLFVNEWYTVRAEVRGDHIKCFLSNGIEEMLVFDVKDARHLNGRVGIKTLAGTHHFKDIKVTAPNGQVLWQGLPALPPLGPKSDPPIPKAANPVVVKTQEPAKPPVPPEPTKPRPADESFSASIGMKLVKIPAGEFLMGSTPEEYPRNHADEFPKHPVKITRPYLMGTTEVTQGQYRAVTESNPSRFRSGDDYPVENVSWHAAVKFCNDLSRKEGLQPFFAIKDQDVTVPDPLGTGYRLPTEAEWEYACRAGSTLNYSFGNDDDALPNFAWVGSNSGRPMSTHPVGGWRANAFGLHDMHGNLQEFCWDTFAPYSPGPAIDPTGPRYTPDKLRVYRSGAYDDSPFYNRSSYRGGLNPNQGSAQIGFRVVRNLSKQDANQTPAKKKNSR